jgi:TonB dependent receptor/TonB-dependent Receptor Plug Domain
MTKSTHLLSALALGISGLIPAWADSKSGLVPYAESPTSEIVVSGYPEQGSGWLPASSASEGRVGAEALRSQALLRPADTLERVPGMVVTQHSGDGKANQYFLRGMNLDHGTDFATTVNGVPVNMPSHAHGQGYSDLNFLMPELVQRVDYRKGPYFAQDGDFSSAGSAHFVYRKKLDRPLAELTLGGFGYRRGLAAGSQTLSNGMTLLTAFEKLYDQGPWTQPEGLNKSNALLTLSQGEGQRAWSTSLSLYSAHWNATDQIPQRLVDSGALDRFDSLDASDGAKTTRTSLSGEWRSADDNSLSALNWYGLLYDLSLYSNFTYQTKGTGGDQFLQRDKRQVLGAGGSKTWINEWRGLKQSNALGFQVRRDQVRVGLFDSTQRQVTATTRDDEVDQTLWGLYAQNETVWQPWLRSTAGLRLDQLSIQVNSLSNPANSGSNQSRQISPKLSLVFGPVLHTEFYLNAGRGFHSNDARGTEVRIDPKTNASVSPSPALVSSYGQEIGLKTKLVPQLQSTLALWQLQFDSELTYLGDAGTTTAGKASERSGLEWTNHWTPNDWFSLDAAFAWTHARYSGDASAKAYIVNAVEEVGYLSAVLKKFNTWTIGYALRYIGPAPLTNDNTVRSSPSLTHNLRILKKINANLETTIDVLNLWDKKNADIQYYYASQAPGETSPVDGLHIHPAEPRSFRWTVRWLF